MDIKRKGLLAKTALIGATLIWGSSFVIMKNIIVNIPVYYLLAIRFSAATILLSLLFIKRLKDINTDYLIKGSVMGLFLFCAFVSQTFGLMWTTPGKNAFLTTVYCIFVPFLYWLCSRTRPDRYNISASLICVIGIGFVSLKQDFSIGLGEGLTLVCGLFYALHIVAVARFSQGRDIFLLTIVQFATAAFLGWICGIIFEVFPGEISISSALSLAYLCIIVTTVALLLQNIGQKYTEASSASIILSLESVFGVMFSIIFYKEILTLRVCVGFALIFAAVIISETKLAFIRRSKQPTRQASC